MRVLNRDEPRPVVLFANRGEPDRPGQTLAVYMGVSMLAALRGTLNGVVAQAPAWHAGGPALLLVGEVAAEAEEARLAA